MAFTPIQKLIPRALKKLGVDQEAKAALICERYRRCAPRIVHADVLEHSFPRYFKNGTLMIGAENSAWAQEITMKAHLLLEEIRREETIKYIKQIRTTVTARKAGPQP